MKKGICEIRYCTNKSGTRKLCSTCRSKKSRKKDPVRYAYQTLKDNAKRRHKPFTISFEYFKQFCYETEYIRGKGKTANSLSIDCKENALGYVEGNIRALTLSENSKKGTKVLQYDWQTGYATVTENKPREYGEDSPF